MMHTFHNSYRKIQQDATAYQNLLFHIYEYIWSSTCFGRHTTHHQETKTALVTSCLHMWKVVERVHVQQLSTYANQRLLVQFQAPDDGRCVARNMLSLYKYGIINSDSLLHLVGFFCMNCTNMHESTNIKHSTMFKILPLRLNFFNNKSFFPEIFFYTIWRKW
jgi:hypothetical protein